MSAHPQKACLIAAFMFAISVPAIAAPDHAGFVSAQTNFKVRYHRWVAAIYDKPEILLHSDIRVYTNLPEFTEIVKLGRPALPAIAEEIEKNSDMAVFLGEAIFQITGWRTPPSVTGVQDRNALLLRRLREQKIIPEANKEPNQSPQPIRASGPLG